MSAAYDFAQDYDREWQEWIAELLPHKPLREGHIALEISDWCHKLDLLIRRLYSADPSYSTQVEIYRHWQSLLHCLKSTGSPYPKKALQWFARQLMHMITCNDAAIVESVWYCIGVDYFECGEHGKYLFPILYAGLPEASLPQLMLASCSIPWADKVATYRKLIAHPAQHRLLATAIGNSCRAYCYGSARASEAMEILQQLAIDPETRARLAALLTTPIPVHVQDAQALPAPTRDGITGFVTLDYARPHQFPTWFPYAELWVDGQYVGTFDSAFYQLTHSSVEKDYGIKFVGEPHPSDKLLAVKIPFDPAWAGQDGEVRPT